MVTLEPSPGPPRLRRKHPPPLAASGPDHPSAAPAAPEGDAAPRTVRAVLTERRRDRQGDLVEPAGLDFAEYLKNPVVLWAHDQSLPPVGRLLKLDRAEDRVEATVQFADTEFGRELFGLYEQGYLAGWSLGFLPRRWRPLPAEGLEPEAGTRDGEWDHGVDGRSDDDGEGGHHILEAEVVEVSAVPVPANAGALTRALPRIRTPLLRRALQRKACAAGDDEPPPPAAGAALTPRQFLRLGMELLERLSPAVVAQTLAVHAGRLA